MTKLPDDLETRLAAALRSEAEPVRETPDPAAVRRAVTDRRRVNARRRRIWLPVGAATMVAAIAAVTALYLLPEQGSAPAVPAPTGVNVTSPTPGSVPATRTPSTAPDAVTSAASSTPVAAGGGLGTAQSPARVPVTPTSKPAPAGDRVQTLWPVGPTSAWALVDLPDGGPQELLRTADAGASWANVTPPAVTAHPEDAALNGGFALDADDAWAVHGPIASGSAQTLSVTTDGGLHWTGEGTLPTPGGCTLQFVDPHHGWCTWIGAAMGSSTVHLWRTADAGRNWSLILNTQPGHAGSAQIPPDCDKTVRFTDATTGWVTTHCNGGPAPLYRTTDGGTHWARVHVTPPMGQLDAGDGFTGIPTLDPSGHGAVAFTVDGVTPTTVIYRTTNGGATWQPITPPHPHQGWCVGIVTPTSWRLISETTLLSTDNAGRTWNTTITNRDFGQPRCGEAIDFTTEQAAWFPYNGQLYRSTNGGATWTHTTITTRE